MVARLTLVGAGPGDPELITLKGVRALQQANVVLYDALAHPDLLQHCQEACEKIFVGKKVGVCQFKQEDINQLIVDKALSQGHVVRLKGGDPYIFGRGHEEIEFARQHGVQTQVIPGLSSFYSVPELRGIPLTRRGINESVWVLTGSNRDHQLSQDVALAARTNTTAVVLMGMTKLPEIIAIYQEAGKGELPVAIIQDGTWAQERCIGGTVNSILPLVRQHGIGSPAVIVLGEVARLLEA
ncbi:MAG: uroporphyrinogen-III C-methyltransferase [Cytophagaceae bacterium]|jgi:uroporphyrin-III C-methyltransferase|nr:uroporphyrinogen-III C-methyltransferase [Cytophagaceae bacterium]